MSDATVDSIQSVPEVNAQLHNEEGCGRYVNDATINYVDAEAGSQLCIVFQVFAGSVFLDVLAAQLCNQFWVQLS